MAQRVQSTIASDASKTETGFVIEGHLQEGEVVSRLQLPLLNNNILCDGIFSKELLSGEVSMISNFDNVKSAEWNNLKDLNDQPDSAQTQGESNQPKQLVHHGGSSTKKRQAEQCQQREEKKAAEKSSATQD